MIELPRNAPASIACHRSGLPLLAVCPSGHRRTVPFRRLRTGSGDTTALYARTYKCRVCGSTDVTLFAIESHEELDAIRASWPREHVPAAPPSSYLPDPDAEPL